MLGAVEVRKPHPYPYTVRLFDRLMDTHGVDAQRSLRVLIGEVDAKGSGAETLRRLAVGWAAANRTYQEQFRNKSPEQVFGSFAHFVDGAETGFRETLQVSPRDLETTKGMRKFVDALGEQAVLPEHELHTQGTFLTEEAVRAFLRSVPPRKLLEGSPYVSIDDALRHYDGLTILSLARKSRDETWLGEQEAFFHGVQPDDFAERPIQFAVVDAAEFPSLVQSVDAVSWGDKAAGVIVLRTLAHEDSQRRAAVLFTAARAIHYIHEVYDFGIIAAPLLERHAREDLTSHLPALFWGGMKKRADTDAHFFGVHALLEQVFWTKTLGNLAAVLKDRSSLFRPDFPATERLIQAKEKDGREVVIGGHPLNLISQFFEGKVRENSTTKRGIRLHFFRELVKNNDLKEIEIILLKRLKEGFVDIAEYN